MRLKLFISFLLITVVLTAQCPDPNWPDKAIWANAGVDNGAGPRTYSTIWPDVITVGEDINAIMAAAHAAHPGGVIVLLGEGIHIIDDFTGPIQYPGNNVVLRGVNKSTSIIHSYIRNTNTGGGDPIRKFNNGSIQIGRQSFQNIEGCGYENITYKYIVPNCEPTDDISGTPEAFASLHVNGGTCGRTDLHNIAIQIWGDNNWVIDSDFLESGSNPIEVWGDHNSVERNLFARTYNKGGSNNGYAWWTGNYNLIRGNVFQRLRHVVVDGYNTTQNGSYNVFHNNTLFRVEFNLHDGGAGHNLFENNIVSPEQQHHVGGQPFNTGRNTNGNNHLPPGPNDVIYNNDTSGSGKPNYAGVAGNIYTFEGYQDVTDKTGVWPQPLGGTFYCPASSGTVSVTGVTVTPSTASILTTGTVQLSRVISPGNATDQTGTWSSDAAGVATVNSSGLVSGVSAGTATITYTTNDGSFTDTSVITVETTLSGDSIDVTGPYLYWEPTNLDPAVTVDGNAVSTWTDSSGYGLDGTVVGTVSLNLGASTRQAEFSGDGYLDIAANSLLDFAPGTDEFTIIYREGDVAPTSGYAIAKRNASTQVEYSIAYDAGNFRDYAIGGPTEDLSSTATDNNRLVITVVSTSGVDVWIDGAQIITGGAIGTSTASGYALNVGARTAGIFDLNNGAQIDMVAIIPKAISTVEREAIETEFIVNTPAPPDPPGTFNPIKRIVLSGNSVPVFYYLGFKPF